MCVFCAAVPAVIAVGAHAQKNQILEKEQAELRGEPQRRVVIPAGTVTKVVVVGLVTASIFYHTNTHLWL